MTTSTAIISPVTIFANDAISDLIKSANETKHLVNAAVNQVSQLSTKLDEWFKAKNAHFHARDFQTPKPILWADESYDFDYENDGSISLTFYNDDDSTLIFNATSEVTSEINKGFGFVAFDELEITNIVIIDRNENTYKVHAKQELACEILENYINLAASDNHIEYSTSAAAMRESAADNASYHRNTHAYYGMSQADF